MTQAPDRAALLRQLSQLERPSLARCPSLLEHCEDRAAKLYTVGIEAGGVSQRELGRRIGRDERLIRDYKEGARAVHLAAALALPREGQLALLRTWLEQLGADAEDERGAA